MILMQYVMIRLHWLFVRVSFTAVAYAAILFRNSILLMNMTSVESLIYSFNLLNETSAFFTDFLLDDYKMTMLNYLKIIAISILNRP